MRTRTENLTDVVAPKLTGPALGAGLLGIGQNGLLVMLPQLVSLTGLSLSVWAGLLMFGSMLFTRIAGGDARASGTAVRSLCWPRWAATGELRRDGAGSLGDGERRAECPLGNGFWFCRACCTA